MDYQSTQMLLERTPDRVYALLLTEDRELDQAQSHPSMKRRLEEILSHPLRDRTVDWRVVYENVNLFLLDSEGSLEQALVLACYQGLLTEVSILLEVGADPSWNKNSALMVAAQRDMPDIVEVLLSDERVDPTVNGNIAYWNANRDGHFDVAAILENDPRVRRLLS